MKISRRNFGKKLGTLAVGFSAYISSHEKSYAAPQKSRIILTQSEKLKRSGYTLPKEIVSPFLDQAMMKLTQSSSPLHSWKSLFSPNEKVGIKLSCLPGIHLSSNTGLVMAIVDSLIACGLNPKNIYIWERTQRELETAGFSSKNFKCQVIGTDSGAGDGYLDNIEFAGSVGTRFSWIMEKVDALINVPVLKDHDLSGVSIGMKNFYGAIYNPNKYHRNNCNPYVAELNTHPLIKNKLRLIICDASRIQLNNGPAFYPQFAWEYGGLLIGTDPVALDYTGWQLIEKGRKNMNLKSLSEIGREPKYIASAASLGLGTNNDSLIIKNFTGVQGGVFLKEPPVRRTNE